MKAKAFIEDDWMRDGISIHLADQGESSLHVIDFAGTVVHVEELRAAERPTYEPLRLSQDMARAMYEAMAHHFGGHPETASLRKDYEAERARVDLFIAKAVQP